VYLGIVGFNVPLDTL